LLLSHTQTVFDNDWLTACWDP